MESYATGYCATGEELFLRFDYSKQKAKQGEYLKATGSSEWLEICNIIFVEFLYNMFDDLVENNTTFEIPYGKDYEANIHIKRFDREIFSKFRKKNAMMDFDPLSTNFSGFAPVLEWGKKMKKEQKITIPKVLTDKLVSYANDGKQYS